MTNISEEIIEIAKEETLKKVEINEKREYQQVDGVLIKFEPRDE